MAQEVFRRIEQKYILTQEQFAELLGVLRPHLERDEYFSSTNCSIYYDTEDNWLAIRSLEKPVFKEKFRVRSYGVPTLDDTVFLEIKSKYNGIGAKRRVGVKLRDFYDYLENGRLICENPQIKSEIDYRFNYYNLKPTIFIAYDRQSYRLSEDDRVRITFDFSIRTRTDNLRLEEGDQGELYYDKHEIVMEIKSSTAYPIWLSKVLNRRRIYPASNSKFGNVYRKIYNQREKENV